VDLARFEAVVGQRLPENLRKSWLIHDGRLSSPEDFESEYFREGCGGTPGFIFGQALNPLVSLDSMSRKLMLRAWSL
jgi:hypothetical protein